MVRIFKLNSDGTGDLVETIPYTNDIDAIAYISAKKAQDNNSYSAELIINDGVRVIGQV